jgi:hypothetical protein
MLGAFIILAKEINMKLVMKITMGIILAFFILMGTGLVLAVLTAKSLTT